MLIAKLSISYDRGTALNRKEDLTDSVPAGDIFGRGTKTADGKVIRGIGSHFRSEADKNLAKERDQDAARIRNAFRSRFLITPLDGVYIMPSAGAGKMFVKSFEHRPDVRVSVTEFMLESAGGLDAVELSEWANRIKRQFAEISLGRSEKADEDGLKALESLSKCPALKPSTGTRIREMVASVRDAKMTRIEIRRNIETMPFEIEPAPLAPRRMPKLREEAAA